MPAKKKAAKKVAAKKSAPKKSVAKKTASRRRSEDHRTLDEKNQLIIIGGVVAIILFVLGSVFLEKSREQQNFHPQPINIESPQGSSSAGN